MPPVIAFSPWIASHALTTTRPFSLLLASCGGGDGARASPWTDADGVDDDSKNSSTSAGISTGSVGGSETNVRVGSDGALVLISVAAEPANRLILFFSFPRLCPLSGE